MSLENRLDKLRKFIVTDWYESETDCSQEDFDTIPLHEAKKELRVSAEKILNFKLSTEGIEWDAEYITGWNDAVKMVLKELVEPKEVLSVKKTVDGLMSVYKKEDEQK